MLNQDSIFISYRRSDSIAETGRIYDRLVADFGRERVFKDVDSIPFGIDFAEYLDQAVSQCHVLLVIIGKTWLNVTEPDGTRRIDNPNDFVRIEIESALRRRIPVVPVLLEGATMPRSGQLPEALAPLARRNAAQVGYDPRFHDDMSRLVKGIQNLLRISEGAPEGVTPAVRPHLGSAPTRSVFSFETVTLDAQNRVNHPQQQEAQYFREELGNGITLDMVLIPGGSFLMGSPEDELERLQNEGPQHEVKIATFFIGRYPVTQAQWQAVAALPRIKRDLNLNPAGFKGENHPIERATWDDATEFCKRLEAFTGRLYSLPSEAEWEYACRAGSSAPFHFGETLTPDLANYNSDYVYGKGPKGRYRSETTPIDSFGFANAFGLSDMHGNVWEWCQDLWHDNYEEAPTNGDAWLNQQGEDGRRVIRGGSWCNPPKYCRSASRGYDSKDSTGRNLGFRVVCRDDSLL